MSILKENMINKGKMEYVTLYKVSETFISCLAGKENEFRLFPAQWVHTQEYFLLGRYINKKGSVINEVCIKLDNKLINDDAMCIL